MRLDAIGPRARRLGEMALLGALLFALGQLATREPQRRPLRVEVLAGSPAAERARQVEEAVLLAEAKRRDLLRHDPFVLHRVAANLAALHTEEERAALDDEDPPALLARALALGMVDRDPLLRAHLLRRMRARGKVEQLVAGYAAELVEVEGDAP
ncbi:MAG: hypothetical protein AAF447_01950 [Myxococcota bacterium]